MAILNAGKKKITIIVPGKTKGQGRPRFSTKTGRAYDPKDSVDEKAYIRLLAQQEMERRKWTMLPPDMPVECTIISYRIPASGKAAWYQLAAKYNFIAPTKKPDTDNVQKLVYDALSGIVYADDKQIFKVNYEARFSEAPRLEITFAGYYVDFGAVKEAVRRKKAEESGGEGNEG